MSSHWSGGHGKTTFECVDKSFELIPGLAGDHIDSGVFYNVEPTCSGIPCPPYFADRELTCVVCTR